MPQKLASVGALTSIGARLEVSFDGGNNWRRIFGVYSFNTSGGDAQIEDRQPIDSSPYRRASRRGNQDLNLTIDNLSWMEGIRKVEERLDDEESFTIRIVRPEIILSSFTGNVQAAIAASTGAVTFSGSGTRPDLLQQPYGVGNGIQIANKMHVIDAIDYDSATGNTTVKVAPAPTAAVAAGDFTIVRPGCIFGPAEVVGGNMTDDWGNAGAVQQAAVFHLSGRLGSPQLVIGLA